MHVGDFAIKFWHDDFHFNLDKYLISIKMIIKNEVMYLPERKR